jgi:hypothetical protein
VKAPLVGRKTITAWVENVLAKMPGYSDERGDGVSRHSSVRRLGDRWATEHQVAQAPEGNPNLDGYGKMALVLHREAVGGWKIQQEMSNASPKPRNK